MVEQRTENPRVAGSIPALGILYGILAQLVEHLTFNQVVGGSNPPCLIKIEFIVICYGLFLVYRKMLVALREANENCEAILGGQNAGFAFFYFIKQIRHSIFLLNKGRNILCFYFEY